MFKDIFKDKHTKDKCHILKMLQTGAGQGARKHLSFHTPGHKQRGADITELSYSDNLLNPVGVIAKAQEDIARILGAEKSFILTDGSTSGIFAMLYAAKKAGVNGVTVIANAHISVYNACGVLGLAPFFAEDIEGAKAHSTTQAVLITSPSYYGKIENLAAWKAYCEKKNKYLLIDGAHGGHLHYQKNIYAGAYADMWVDGVHKSLPAYTQGAVVSARGEQLALWLEEGVKTFRTSSPSYPIMASVEYAVKYPKNERLESEVRAYANEQSRVEVQEDYTKLCAVFGKTAFAADSYLQSKGVYSEFCDGERVMFYLSPATTERQFKALKRALKTAFARYPYQGEESAQPSPAPVLLPKNAKTEWRDLEDCEGKICAGACGLFPPCTILLQVGERIQRKHIEFLKSANHTHGVWQGKLLVYQSEKEEEQ